MNEGAKRLTACNLSLAEAVTALKANGQKASRVAVKRWRDGTRVPAEGVRAAFAAPPFEIPLDAWDLLPGAASAKKTARAGLAKHQAPKRPDVREPASPPDESAAGHQRDLLTRIQRWRGEAEFANASPTARAQLAELEQRAIRELAALTGEKAQPDAVLLKSPQWGRLTAKILEALEGYPDAARAVRAALA